MLLTELTTKKKERKKEKRRTKENRNATWCTITREVLVGTPVGCLQAYNSG